MAINDEIAAGGRPIQFENPLNNMVKFANIQNDMANMALHRQKMATDAASTARQNELNNYLGSGGRDPNRIYQLGGQEALNHINQANSARITGEKTEGETLDAAIKRGRGIFQDFVHTPQDARQFTYMQFTDPVMKKYMESLGVSFEQAVARIPKDPAEFRNYKEQYVVGMKEHLDNLAVKTTTNLGNRYEQRDGQGRLVGEPMMMGATVKERAEIDPAILSGIARQDELRQQIAQGNPSGQAPVASQTNQLLNASVAQANDQTAPPIAPLAANVNRPQAEFEAVTTKLRADQQQAAADKKAFEFKTLVADVAKLEADGEGNSPTAQRLKARIAKETHIPPDSSDLSEEQNNALYGPNGAVTQGRLDPYKVNGRSAKIYANAEISTPGTNMNQLAGAAAVNRNAPFMAKQYAIEMLPKMLANVGEAGKKLNFSDNKYFGELQAWYKGASNDPDFRIYMAQRMDTLLTLTGAMRAVGMSDLAQKAEDEAAPKMMSPRAFDAYIQGQYKALEPRLALSRKFTGSKPPAEAEVAAPHAHPKTKGRDTTNPLLTPR
jgi:hypothetical protein